MSKNKIVYIIPGFGEKVTDRDYKKISFFAKKEGYLVVPVPIIWNNRTTSHWLTQFRELVNKKGENAVVVGFSFGAYLSILASKEFNFKKLVVCSLSPYFSEDLKSFPKLFFIPAFKNSISK